MSPMHPNPATPIRTCCGRPVDRRHSDWCYLAVQRPVDTAPTLAPGGDAFSTAAMIRDTTDSVVIVTACKRCGAAIYCDRRDGDFDALAVHMAWHDRLAELTGLVT